MPLQTLPNPRVGVPEEEGRSQLCLILGKCRSKKETVGIIFFQTFFLKRERDRVVIGDGGGGECMFRTHKLG